MLHIFVTFPINYLLKSSQSLLYVIMHELTQCFYTSLFSILGNPYKIKYKIYHSHGNRSNTTLTHNM